MPALAFVVNKHNLNSIAALTGALEVDPRTAALSLHFFWQDERLLPRLRTLAEATEKLVSADLHQPAADPAPPIAAKEVRRLVALG